MSDDQVVLATNPDKLEYKLGECTGGGPSDGMELLVMCVEAWTNETTGKEHPQRNIAFTRETCKMTIIAMTHFLCRTEADRDTESESSEVDV